MSKLISVIVPVYKAEKWLERCVNSILNQTYRNLEIILVEDGSPDNSGALCDELSKIDNRIVVLHTPNGGAARARNIGLNRAIGEFIGFVDSDDYIEPEMYQCLLLALEKKSVDISCAGMIRENQDGSGGHIIRCPREEMQFNDCEIIREILLGRYIGSSLCTKLYTRKCWDKVRLPEGETNEDTKVTFELYKRKRMIHVAKPMYHYTVNSDGVTHTLTYDNYLTTFSNAESFVSQAEKEYPSIKNAATYYLTDTAKVLLMQENVSEGTELYRKCKSVLDANYRVLGFDWRAFMLRIGIYQKIKSILRGKKGE